MRRPFVVLLLLCLAAGLWLHLAPGDAPPSVGHWDKVHHAVGFYILGAVALAAFPAGKRWQIFSGLLAYGGLAEALQAIPALHRDADGLDLAADALGIGMALIPTFLRKS